MTDDELAYTSATEVLDMYRGRRLSPVEYLDASIERMNTVGSLVNAFGETYLDEAREAAQRAEQTYSRGGPAARPLEGLLVAIKDETPVAGKVTTVGSLVHDPTPETHDAVVVERLRDAGAIVLGRTTTPEFCGAPFTHSRVWGVTRNPWNPDFSPGGSSGGAAAALAAGLVPLADGSDIAGSVRIPASFCGVVGFKPPYGRVPGIPLYNLDTYNHQGPLARTVADAALMQDVLAGPDPRDVATVPSLVTVSDVEADVRGLRIGVCEDMGGFNCDEEIRAAVRLAAERFRALGAIVEQVDVGWTFDQVQRAARAHYKAVFGAEMDDHAQQHPEKLTPYILDFIEVLSASDTSYLHGLETEAKVHAGLRDVFTDYDLLLGPVLTTTGFIAGEDYVDTQLVVNGQRVEHWLDTLPTMVFNIGSRHPVAVVPVTRASNGVPIGMQIAGRMFDDRTVFRAAKAFEAQDPWFATAARRPGLVGSAPAPS